MEAIAGRCRTNLAEVGRRLTAAGVDAVIIKSGLETTPSPLGPAHGAPEYGDFVADRLS